MNIDKEKRITPRYKPDQDIGKKIKYNGETLKITMAPYRLVLKREDGSEYGHVDVDFYFDAVQFCNGSLYIGTRDGEILKVNLSDCSVEKKFFLSDEVWESLQNHMNMAPMMNYVIKNHLLGNFSYMMEMNVMNDHVYHSAVTSLASEKNLLAAGDVNGRVTVWNTDDGTVVDAGEMPGAVTALKFAGPYLFIDHIDQKGIEDPGMLAKIFDGGQARVTVKEVR